VARNGAYHRFATGRRRRRSGRSTPRWLIAIAVLGGILVISMAVMAGIGFGVYQGYANDLVPPDEEIAKQPQGGARILDREGNLLYQYVDDASGLRDPVALEDI
jgi:hypothetical protein